VNDDDDELDIIDEVDLQMILDDDEVLVM